MTGVLAAFVVYCLLAGRVSLGWALGLAAAAGAFFLAGHHHGDALGIDGYARRSRLSAWNTMVKLGGSVTVLILCVASPGAVMPLVMALVLGAVTAWGGGLGWRRYLALLRLPAAFLLLSALALLWSVSSQRLGVLTIPFFGKWLVVTAASQARTALVVARAVGAVSCLYLLSLSTPMPQLLSALRRLRVPDILLDLAVLIYRYIFILLSVSREMRAAAASRLGYDGLGRSLRTTGAVYGNLLAKSFRRAGACFDAMESRCYDGQIRFLERSTPVGAAEVWTFAGLIILAAGLLAAGAL